MNKYQSYKPSSIEWIGEVPYTWNLSKNKFLFFSGMGETILKENLIDDGKIPVYSATQEDTIFGFVNSSNLILEEGDIVIPARGNSIGYVMIVEKESTSTQTTIYLKKKSNSFSSKFIFYFFKGFKENLFQFDNTAIPQITVGQIKDNPVILPPLNEQLQIVQFLDDKTYLIDKLISTKERKISLLKEQRTSLINQVVTKGLNPNVKMKYSGVEWIGEIPEHWKFIPMKYFTNKKNGIQTGPFGTQLNTKDYTVSGVKVLNQKTLINDEYELGEEFISYEKYEELKGFSVGEGDLIMGTRGSFGTSNRTTFGKVSEVPSGLGDCVLHPCLIRIRLNETILIKSYFKYYINDSTLFLDQIKNTSNSTTIEVIYGVTLRDIKIPIPSIMEQTQIVEHLDSKTKEIDVVVQLEQKKIDLLKEYRQSLISEVVTGKIKVTTD